MIMLPLRAVLARWSLPSLARGLSTTAVAHEGGHMSRDAVTFYHHMRRDAVLVGLLVGLGSLVGYSMYDVSIDPSIIIDVT